MSEQQLTPDQKARPMLFSAPMIQALLAGRKTQTRRIVKPQPEWDGKWFSWNGHAPNSPYGACGGNGLHAVQWMHSSCPYGRAGDFLWVRETHAIVGSVDPGWVLYRANGYESECRRHRFDNPPPESEIKWRPSIHMPRWASRITLRIASVRVERLQDISYEDAVAEGCGMPEMRFEPVGDGETWEQTSRRLQWPQRTYESLWNSINGKGSWDVNPWVWVVSFERVESMRAAA